MPVRRWSIGLAVLAFIVVLFLRLPLTWVRPLLPGNVSCDAPSGSIWQGRCGNLSINARGGPLPIGPLSWNLRRSALLRARLAGTLQVDGPQLRGHAAFEAGLGGTISIRDLDAAAPLDRRLLGMVPSNWTGRLTVQFPELEMKAGTLQRLRGTLEARDVVAQGPKPDEFGSYSLTFAGNDEPDLHRGMLRDLDGPLELGGSIDLRRNLDWQINALVKARPNATPQLSRLLEFLGPPDAEGRRRFSAEGDL
jgi:general secretion pathway protein N